MALAAQSPALAQLGWRVAGTRFPCLDIVEGLGGACRKGHALHCILLRCPSLVLPQRSDLLWTLNGP